MKNASTKSTYNAQRLFFIFGLTYLTSGIFALIFAPTAPFDAQMHDTYFVIDSSFMLFSVAGFLLLLVGIYRLAKHFNLRANYKLEITHFLLTLIPIIGISTLALVQNEFVYTRRYYTFDSFYALRPIEINAVLTILGLVVLFAQVLFGFNVLFAMYKKWSQKR